MGSILTDSDFYQPSLVGDFLGIMSVPSGMSAITSMISPSGVFIGTQSMLQTTITRDIQRISGQYAGTTLNEINR